MIVAAFYHFFDFSRFAESRPSLLAEMKKMQVNGTVLVAPEGINGTVAGGREGVDALLSYISQQVVHGSFPHKESECEEQPFRRAKVKLKRETISLGESVAIDAVGEYVTPQNWNALIADPDYRCYRYTQRL